MRRLLLATALLFCASRESSATEPPLPPDYATSPDAFELFHGTCPGDIVFSSHQLKDVGNILKVSDNLWQEWLSLHKRDNTKAFYYKDAVDWVELDEAKWRESLRARSEALYLLINGVDDTLSEEEVCTVIAPSAPQMPKN